MIDILYAVLNSNAYCSIYFNKWQVFWTAILYQKILSKFIYKVINAWYNSLIILTDKPVK